MFDRRGEMGREKRGRIPWRGLNRSLPNTGDLDNEKSAGWARMETTSKPYLKDIPYCDTCSYPVFHTRVTSQAFVAWSLQDKKAETGFPPTVTTFISSLSSIFGGFDQDAACAAVPQEIKVNECGDGETGKIWDWGRELDEDGHS